MATKAKAKAKAKALKTLPLLVIPRLVRIKVTRKNIDTGVFENTEKCAIALAVKAKLGDSPEVDSGVVTVELPCGVEAVYKLPKEAKKFIAKFDGITFTYSDNPTEQKALQKKARAKLKPFSFVAELIHAEFNGF